MKPLFYTAIIVLPLTVGSLIVRVLTQPTRAAECNKPYLPITVSALYSDSPGLYSSLHTAGEVQMDNRTVWKQQRKAALQLSALQDTTLRPLRNLTEDKNFDMGVKNKFNPVPH